MAQEHPPATIGEPAIAPDPATAATPPKADQDDDLHHAAAALEAQNFLPIVSYHALVPESHPVVDLVNVQRQLAGCGPLRISSQLTEAAQGHSEDMAFNDFFSHTSYDGRSPWDRIREAGYRFRSAAENIAAGYPTADSAVAAWMNSSGHRANILNCQLQETGVGYFYMQPDSGQVNYRHYWTQVFASPAN